MRGMWCANCIQTQKGGKYGCVLAMQLTIGPNERRILVLTMLAEGVVSATALANHVHFHQQHSGVFRGLQEVRKRAGVEAWTHFLEPEGEHKKNLAGGEFNDHIVVRKVRSPCTSKRGTGRIREGFEDLYLQQSRSRSTLCIP